MELDYRDADGQPQHAERDCSSDEYKSQVYMRQAFQHAVSCLPLHFSVQTEDEAGEDAAGGTLQVQTHQSLPYSFSHLTLSLVTVIHLAIWLELISLYILPHMPLSLLPQAAEMQTSTTNSRQKHALCRFTWLTCPRLLLLMSSFTLHGVELALT